MSWVIMTVVTLVSAAAAFLLVQNVAAKEDVESGPMSLPSRRVLVVYLLALGFTLIYLLVKLASIDFPDPALTVEASGNPDVTALSKGTGPAVFHAFPYLKSAPGAQSPTYELAIYGDRFQKDAKVRLNGEPFPPLAALDDNLLRVVPENKFFQGIGSLTVEVVNPDGHLSNALSLRIARPRMPLKVFYFLEWSITREVQLLLMVLFAGALGSFVHALKSLSDFIGNRTAVASWFWWYITRPFLGATMALIFYAVLRGGFLTGTPADVRVVNPFGAIAVAALVGMFADKAAQKLAEIFETLFKADDKRGGRLAAPVIDKVVPSTVRVGSKVPVEVKLSGEHLGRVTAVKVNGVERTVDSAEARQVVFKLLPSDVEKVSALTLSVVSPDGTSPAVTVKVSDLRITTSTVPPGRAGQPYTAPVTATGGKAPLKWTMTAAPDGLKIDTDTGGITGEVAAAGSHKPVVTATDAEGVSDSRTFDLQVTQ